MTGDATQELAARLEALGASTRLRLLGLLARRARHGEELAAALEISPSTAGHHLKLLRQAGMVSITRENPYVLFRPRPETLRTLGSSFEDPHDLAETLDLPPEDSMDRDHVGPWLDERGRLTELPNHRRHRQTVLRWVLDQLDPAHFDAEAELRLTLDSIAYEPDALRDLLVDAGFLRKSGSVYRVVETVGTE